MRRALIMIIEVADVKEDLSLLLIRRMITNSQNTELVIKMVFRSMKDEIGMIEG